MNSFPRKTTADAELVRQWYAAKTESLLERYRLGASPIVHYHLGIPLSDAVGGELAHLRECVVEAQGSLLLRLLQQLDTSPSEATRLLDVGCGLGGTCIWLACHTGARCTGVTIASEHVEICRRLATEAGVGSKTRFIRTRAESMHFVGKFHTAMAVESLCQMDRRLVFGAIASALKPGGQLLVSDPFARNAAVARLTGTAYHSTLSRMGSLSSYDEEAKAAGLVRTKLVDLTDAVASWWRLSAAYHAALASAPSISERQQRDNAARSGRHLLFSLAFGCRAVLYFIARYDRASGRLG